MTYRKYTQCFTYTGAEKPFNLDRSLPLVVITFAFTVLSSTIVGLVLGAAFVPPVGAVIGAGVGVVVGIASGVASTIVESANKWLNHRLVCLGNPRICAVGTITTSNPSDPPKPPEKPGPRRSELGALDNDEFFDLQLMPHRKEDDYIAMFEPRDPDQDPSSPAWSRIPPKYGAVRDDEMKNIRDHPENEIYADGFQGQTLLKPDPDNTLLLDLGYLNQKDHPGKPWNEEYQTRSRLHVEAEGDFWLRMKDSAAALGALATAAVAATAAGTAGGAHAGSAAGCALGSWFFGPIGCAIGAIIGGILGGLGGGFAAGAGSAVVVMAVLQAKFDESPGEIDDANVGDLPPGGYTEGNRVVVLGEHVYDGFHQGWHEMHPLMAIKMVSDPSSFITWDPNFSGTPPDGLTDDDMKKGMSSPTFAARVKDYHARECRGLQDAFAEQTRKVQQQLTHRWSIHPLVDGCEPDPHGPN